MTARQAIIKVLYESPRPLAIHELPLEGISQTSASARLRELKQDGIVVSVPVKGQRFTAWMLKPSDLVLPLTVVAQ